MFHNRIPVTLTFLVALFLGHVTRADSPWQFTDIEGKLQKPFNDESTRALVLVFISTDCPIANSYQPLLHRMAEEHAENGIRFIMIHPGPGTDSDAARKHARDFGIEVPVVIDTDQSISRRVGATVTPQAFVFVRDQSAPAYQGRIDDLYADYGKKRPVATRRELANALEAIVDGKPVEPSMTDAIGCFISFQEKQPATPPIDPATYDPLKIDDREINTLKLVVKDEDRSREIPILVYLPESGDAAPVIIHSHGLGGTRETSPFLGKHWAARGYIAVFTQHPGSDDSVWKDVPALRRMNAMKKAGNAQNLTLRAGDIPAVIDQLEAWNADDSHALHNRMNLKQIGMSGHSFGALTTQYVSGQTVLGQARYTDERIRAAIPMSPSTPKMGDVNKAFGAVKIPWLCMTGTHDVAPIGGADMESRLGVYPALPAGNKYELVLNNAEHSVFTETALRGDSKPRNPAHHRAIMALSTAFWDSYLRDDSTARAWLESDAARTVLDTEDRWQKK